MTDPQPVEGDWEPTHRVIAPLAIVPLPDGQQRYVYEGGVLPELPDEEIERLSDAGLIAPIDEEVPVGGERSPQEVIKEIIARQPDRVEQASPLVPAGERSGEKVVDRPSRAASRSDWIDYAVAQGMDRPTAEAMSRDELADHFARRG